MEGAALGRRRHHKARERHGLKQPSIGAAASGGLYNSYNTFSEKIRHTYTTVCHLPRYRANLQGLKAANSWLIQGTCYRLLLLDWVDKYLHPKGERKSANNDNNNLGA